MKSVELKATSRNEVRNKAALNSLRKEGRVPAVIYGGEQNVNFHVNEVALSKLINTADAYFIDLNFGEETIKAVIRDVQFHPVTDKPIHVDFLRIFDDKAVSVAVPVVFTGNSIGVMNGGKRREKLRKLVLKALPNDLPEEVKVDVTKLRIGQSIKVKDIILNNVEFMDNENAVIVAIKTSRVAIEDELEEEEGEEGEGTEEGAEGGDGAKAEGGDGGAEKKEEAAPAE